MENKLCELPVHYHAALILIVMLFEAWLGRNTKTKSSSILELVFLTLLSLWKKIFSKEEKHE